MSDYDCYPDQWLEADPEPQAAWAVDRDFGAVIEVWDCYRIKEDLKALGYHWNPTLKVWQKKEAFFGRVDSERWLDDECRKLEKLGVEIT